MFNRAQIIGRLGQDPEIWKSVIGYEGFYEASNLGRIRSLLLGTGGGVKSREIPLILKPKTKRNGYLEVGLNKRGAKTMHYVHRLVLEAFSGPCPNGMECGHIDGNKRENKINNLCWLLQSANSKMSVMQGLQSKGEDRYNAKLNESLVRKIRAEYIRGEVTHVMLAEKYGVTRGAVQSVVNGITWKHVR
jgi:hypothetical protein